MFFVPEGGLLFFSNFHFKFLSFNGMCFLKSNPSPSSCSPTPFPRPSASGRRTEWPNTLTFARNAPALLSAPASPGHTSRFLLLLTFQSQPLLSPHRLKSSSKLADTHGRVFPTIPFSLPVQGSDGGGGGGEEGMHCGHARQQHVGETGTKEEKH